ncbi:ketopantoate reductase family protein [Gynuella sunshinyii]|uniref:2-dehydropantoate 2-reductase n=1 Tax=Gynuella sunshinyii YC6258 TaxID=1445510 RepID=A0A0C5VPF5_9GAMM|nr:2-dehydropantoate 2-reductase [Gynuella sunshinyii]AJQ96537.1 ketopantoate reductase [Gynuella sunshinyii YC6258]
MVFHILGAGAIGTLLATLLADNTHQAILIDRARTPKFDVTRNRHDTVAHYRFKGLDENRPASHLLLCTKAQHVITATRSIEHLISSDTIIIDLANGMGHQQELSTTYPHNPVLYGSVSHGAYWANGKLIYAGEGEIHIGHPNGQRPESIPTLPNCFLWSENIITKLWLKLAVNCAINPLTVINNCKNGELLSYSDTQTIVDSICSEVEQIALRQGISLPDTRQVVHQVLKNTADNSSSTRQDYLNGKSLELEYINGYIVTEGTRLGVATPANRQMLTAVSKLIQK